MNQQCEWAAVRLSRYRARFSVLAVALYAATGSALATPLFAESFTGASLGSPSSWVHNFTSTAACLTAATTSQSQSLAVGTLAGCQATAIDTVGSGALRLTPATTGNAATMLYNVVLPTSGGLDISFNIAQFGGVNHADGISFFIKDGGNTNNAVGAAGGALGYALIKPSAGATSASQNGVPGGLLGIGFDAFGNYTGNFVGLNCPNPDGSSNSNGLLAAAANAVAIRGPDLSGAGDGSSGFCYLGGTAAGSVIYNGADRAAATKLVRIVIDPYTVTPTRNVTVSIGGSQVLQVPVPAAFINTSTFRFGFSGSTGGFTDIHEVWGVTIASVLPIVTVTANGAAMAAGASVPAIGFASSGFTGSDTFSTAPTCAAYTTSAYTTLVTAGTPPGTYVTHCTGGAATGYGFDYVDGTFTVTAASRVGVATAVPTLADWAQYTMTLLLLGAGAWQLRRTRSKR